MDHYGRELYNDPIIVRNSVFSKTIRKVMEEYKTNKKKNNCNHLNGYLSNIFHMFINKEPLHDFDSKFKLFQKTLCVPSDHFKLSFSYNHVTLPCLHLANQIVVKKK